MALIWGVKKFHTYVFARRFTLRTDHKPLTAIFNPAKAIPATTAARLQRYALFLAGFNYDIEYRSSSSHCNADGLSRLPLEPTATEPDPTEDPAHAFHVSQFNILPVTCEKVRRETQRDPTLVKVYESAMKGWNNEQAPSMATFYSRKDELTVHQGCIKWGSRVVVPTKLRRQVLEVLHESHIGVVKMKALADEGTFGGLESIVRWKNWREDAVAVNVFNMLRSLPHFIRGSGHLPLGNVFMLITLDHFSV